MSLLASRYMIFDYHGCMWRTLGVDLDAAAVCQTLKEQPMKITALQTHLIRCEATARHYVTNCIACADLRRSHPLQNVLWTR